MSDPMSTISDVPVIDAPIVAVRATRQADGADRLGEAEHATRASPAECAPTRRSRVTLVLEFARYFVASGGALAVDVGLYQLSLRLGLPYPVAALVGFCAGAVVAYLASVKWVFKARAVRHAGIEFALFVAVGAAGLLLTEALLWIEIGQLGMPALLSKIGAAGVVFVFNFVVRKVALFSVRGR